jgi:benzil reductase ((S)-benzoin forming)
MSDTIVWITGASSGIGAALVEACPFDDAQVFNIARSAGTTAAEHVPADLADPSGWAAVEAHLLSQVGGFAGRRLVFVHNAGTLDPIGFAGEVDSAAYRAQSVLNAAAPQALGHAFLRAIAGFRGEAHLLLLSSGAATSPYPGWSSYCAGKAAVEMWVRTAGMEQRLRAERGEAACRIVAVAPGVVATGMQEQIRAADASEFPNVEKFRGLHERGELVAPEDAARGIWGLLDRDLENGAVVDLRKL